MLENTNNLLKTNRSAAEDLWSARLVGQSRQSADTREAA